MIRLTCSDAGCVTEGCVRLAVVVPAIQFVALPVTSRLTVCPFVALVGLTESERAGFGLTVRRQLRIVPAVVSLTVRVPVIAVGATEMLAVVLVAEFAA